MKRYFSFAILLCFVILCGCSTEPDSNSQRLLISAVADLNMNTQTVNDISYVNITDVTITLDGKAYALHDAIAEGVITVEEIMAYARIDA